MLHFFLTNFNQRIETQEREVNKRINVMKKDGRWEKARQDNVSEKQIKGRLRMNYHNNQNKPGYTHNKYVY